MAVLDPPGTLDHVGLAQCLYNVVTRQAECGQFRGIDIDREFARGPAKDIDPGDTGDRGQCRAHFKFGDLTQRLLIERSRRQRDSNHRKQRRVRPPHVKGRSLRQ